MEVLENKAEVIRKDKKWKRHGKWLERRQSDIKSGGSTALTKF